MFPHLAGDVGHYDMSVVQFDPEGGIGQSLYDLAFHFNMIFFRHVTCGIVSG